MPASRLSRRNFVKVAGTLAGGSLLCQTFGCKQPATSLPKEAALQASGPVDYTLTIAVKPVELAPNRIVSTTTYNGQFPGPLLRFKEGKQVTIDINNQTDTPEQLHWHGQFLSTDVDGAAEEQGAPVSPFEPSNRGYSFTPDFRAVVLTTARVRSSYSMDEWTPPPPPDLTQPQPHSVRLGCLSLWSLRHQ